jgi:catechol 2,3-dioxygenase-like lactoylglutathione lyase family enzyme
MRVRWSEIVGFIVGAAVAAMGGPVMAAGMGSNRVWAVQLGVTDMTRALEYFTEELGFSVQNRDYFPVAVSLRHAEPILLLHAANTPASLDYPEEAQTTLTLRIHDIDAVAARLRERGTEVLHDAPAQAAVGRWIAIRDPFGNVHHLMEPDAEVQPDLEDGAAEPSLYVVGIKVTDLELAERFYSGVLGLPVMTRSYLPRTLPLATEGATVVLHQTASRRADPGYPDAAQTVLIFEVPDLEASTKALRDQGVPFHFTESVDTPVGRYNALRDPFGNVIEMVEPIPSAIDPRKPAVSTGS